MSTTIKVELGALCEPPSKQLAGLLLENDAKQLDAAADAITTLYLLGYLSDAETERCRRRLLKKLQPAVDRCRATKGGA